MQIFQMKIKPDNIRQCVEHGIVTTKWKETGSLHEITDRDTMRQLLLDHSKEDISGQKLGNALGHLFAFRSKMMKGDTLLVAADEYSYVGTLGEYDYNDVVGHHRKVEWHGVFLRELAPKAIQELLKNRSYLTIYGGRAETDFMTEQLKFLASTPQMQMIITDDMVKIALQQLKTSLQSDYEAIRLQASIAILQSKGIL